MLSGVLILFGAGTVTQVVAGCFMSLLSIKIFSFYGAYADEDDDILAEVSQYQLFAILWVGLLLRYNQYVVVGVLWGLGGA